MTALFGADPIGEPTIAVAEIDAPRIRRRRLPWLTLIIIGLFLLGAIFAPLLTPYSVETPDLVNRLQPPGAGHWLGTDTLGRDMLTRLLYGARITVFVLLLALALGAVVGITLGVVAGYFGGILDAVISRTVDAVLAIPALFFGLLLAVTVGSGIGSVVLAVGLVLWSRFARVIRSEVVALRDRDFVAQARIIGCSRRRILTVHIFPNVLSTSMVLLSVNLGEVILLEATLSFLGAGIPPPTSSWGGLISEGQQYISTAWWISVIPGIAILLLVLSFNVLGDWIRERLDPRFRN